MSKTNVYNIDASEEGNETLPNANVSPTAADKSGKKRRIDKELSCIKAASTFIENNHSLSSPPENDLSFSSPPENNLVLSTPPKNNLVLSLPPENSLWLSSPPENNLRLSSPPYPWQNPGTVFTNILGQFS